MCLEFMKKYIDFYLISLYNSNWIYTQRAILTLIFNANKFNALA